jgi:tRNA G37 N-methylase Trm5
LNRALEINSDSTNLWKKSLELNALNGKQERVRISSNRLVELGNSKSDIFIHLIDFFH